MINNQSLPQPQQITWPNTRILSRTIFQNRTQDVFAPPLLHRVLIQTAASGAIGAFLYVVSEMISIPQLYNFLFIRPLPIILGWGALLAIPVGFVIWGCARLLDHSLACVTRIAIAVLVEVLIEAAFLLPHPSDFQEPVALHRSIRSIVLSGFAIGLISGSRVDIWRALAQGAMTLHRKPGLLDMILGFVLRVSIVFGWMESLVILVWVLQLNYETKDLLFALAALVYFTTSAAILFAKVRFWLTASLGLLLNLPLIYLLVLFRSQMGFLTYVVCAYLVLWLTFLISRWRFLDRLFGTIKEEFRYYLFD
jgi:hypothetical protein